MPPFDMPLSGAASNFMNAFTQAQQAKRQREMDEQASSRYADETAYKRRIDDRNYELELKKLDTKAAGVPSKDRLNETAVRNLSEARVIPTQLDELDSLVANQSDVFGPIMGRVRSMNPYDKESAIASSKIKAVAQSIGKYMEGGVLRAEDIPKYAAMLPGVKDTPEVAKGKIANVRKMMQDKYNTDLQSYKMAGYNPGELQSIEGKPQGAPQMPGQGVVDPIKLQLAMEAVQDPMASPMHKQKAMELIQRAQGGK